MVSPWSFAPGHLRLETGWAHVFRFNLDVPFISIDMLSTGEQDRAARFRIETHRQRFIAAHIQVRQVLAAYLDCRPADLAFTTSRYGKPGLRGPSRLRFNLSHSQSQALLAVCDNLEVGIDIEFARENLDLHAIARRFFSPVESAALFALPTPDQPAAFLACWTRKEAYIKARGLGLAIPLDSFDVSILPGQPVSLVDRNDPSAASEWSIAEIPSIPGAAAALAVAGKLDGIRLWDWPAPDLLDRP